MSIRPSCFERVKCLLVGHGVQGRDRPLGRLDAESAAFVATTLQALATPSRLLIIERCD